MLIAEALSTNGGVEEVKAQMEKKHNRSNDEFVAKMLDEERTKAATNDSNVNSPKHYNQGGIECIDAIRAALTEEEYRGFCKGSIIKYVWREKYKNGDEDLEKLKKYADFAINAKDDDKYDF